MKNFMDRMAYTNHRPHFFGKKVMIVANGGAGLKKTLDGLRIAIGGPEVVSELIYNQLPWPVAEKHEIKIFGVMAAAIILVLATGAWESWNRVKATNRITNNAEASIYLFASLHNLRVDRSSSFRDLNNEKPVGLSPFLRATRVAEAAAYESALNALKAVEFPAGNAEAAGLEQSIRKMLALHRESEAQLSLPKAQRRAGIADEYFNLANTIISQLEKLSSEMAHLVKLQDAYVDQLMQLKELAWIMRENAGNAAVFWTTACSGRIAPART